MSKPDDTQQDDVIGKQAKQVFDDSVDALDAATLSRLNRGRQRALAELEPAARWRRWTMWAPAAGLGAAVVVAVLMSSPANSPVLIETPGSDFEILMGEESIDMLEDLEFYTWLAIVDLEEEVG